MASLWWLPGCPAGGRPGPEAAGRLGTVRSAYYLEAIRRLRGGLMSQAQSCQWEAFFFTSFFTLGFLTFFGVLPCVPEPA